MASSFFDSQEEEDRFWVIILIPVALISGVLAPLFEGVRSWLVDNHVLVTENILLPLPGGAGLDWPRVLLLGAAVLGAILITIRVLLHRIRKARAARIERGDES